jgi:Cof subfamily protein (haloacid dehalogenase superfamily)
MKYDSVFLVSDLDGTLTASDRMVHPDNSAALKKFIAGGGRFTVATGREWPAMAGSRENLILEHPLILINGAQIFDPLRGQAIESIFLPADYTGWLQMIIKDYPEIGVVAMLEAETLFLVEPTSRERELPPSYRRFPLKSPADLPEQVYKILLVGKHARLNDVRAHLKHLQGDRLTIVSSDETLLDITAAGVSKGAAIKRLFGTMRRDLAHGRRIFAVGDQENDLTMFAQADVAFAMGQAERPVKQAADYVLPDNSTPMLPRLLRIIDEMDENDLPTKKFTH